MSAINVIAFNIPYPANYGGVIDVYHKLRAFNYLGIDVYLHCFEYGRDRADILNGLCEKVYYYKRNTGLLSNLGLTPYIVSSRRHKSLLVNLKKNNAPILMEGLHCTALLGEKSLKDRRIIYRESNIEHDYYFHLAKASQSWLKKIFFYIEAFRLKRYESKLRLADQIWAVSKEDKSHLESILGHSNVHFLPSFKGFNNVATKAGKGEYVLYHANLSVPENDQAAHYLVDHVFSKIEIPAIVAGLNPTNALINKIKGYSNVEIRANLNEETMADLIKEAHVHVLYTSQATGLKLKLLQVLFNGRYCVANSKMLHGTDLFSLCHIANTKDEMIQKINRLVNQSFTEENIGQRKPYLENYTDSHLAEYAPRLLNS